MSFFETGNMRNLTKALGKEGETVEIRELGNGYNGRGAVLTYTSSEGGARSLFLKISDPHGFGNEASGRRMARHIDAAIPYPYSVPIHGVFALGSEGQILGEVSQTNEVVSVADLLPDSENYLAQIRDPNTTASDVLSRAQIMAMAMAEIHSIKHGGTAEEKRDLYLYATNSIIHDGELVPGVRDFSRKRGDTWMSSSQFARFMANMVVVREGMGANPDRLSRTQGDFWASNVWFDSDNEIRIIDSRTVWGEPGIDAAWMIGEFCMQDLLREGEFGGAFAQVAIEAIAQYQERIGDKELKQFMHLPYAFQAFAEAVFTPGLADQDRMKMVGVGNGALLAHIKGKPFDMMEMNDYARTGLKDLNYENS